MDRRSKIATFDSNFNMTTAVFYSHTSLPAVIIKPSYTLMLLQSRAHFHIAPNVLRKSCSNLQTDCISHFPNPKLHKYKKYIYSRNRARNSSINGVFVKICNALDFINSSSIFLSLVSCRQSFN